VRPGAPVLALLLVLVLPAAAHAHPLLPASLSLLEGRPGRYELRFRRPTRLQQVLHPVLPSDCSASPARAAEERDQRIDTAILSCPGGLSGREIGIAGLAQAELDAIVHVQHRSGEDARALLSPDRERFVVPARTSSWQVLLQYAGLGARHMLEGADHLLFSLGLMLLGTGARVLWLLSAFTLGHSVTLALFALSGLSLPQAPVEVGIALSLIGLALAVLARGDPANVRAELGTSTYRGAGLCFAVGLLHGLGFADGLKQLALPNHALLSGLFGFNLGIELAQLALVGALWPCLWLAARRGPRALRGLRLAGAYATGSLAAMWCIERTLAWLA
jgi:hydrogenase/urease accessory protein HupE